MPSRALAGGLSLISFHPQDLAWSSVSSYVRKAPSRLHHAVDAGRFWARGLQRLIDESLVELAPCVRYVPTMADSVTGKIASEWEWQLQRDDKGTSWAGQLTRGERSSRLSYEHGEAIGASSAKVEGPQHPDMTPETLCAGIWPVVEDYLLSLM